MVFSMRNALALACVAAVAGAESIESRHLQVVNFRQEILDAVNAERKAQDLEPYCLNELLMNAAQVQSNDMAENNFIKSTGSDGSSPVERAKTQGFEGTAVTEVVGAGYRTTESIVAAWTKSASAKKAMFGNFNVMGPGYTFDKTRKFVHYWAVDFAKGECGNSTGAGAGGSGSLDSGAIVGSGSTELSTSGSGGAPASSTSGSAPASSTSGSAPAASTSGSGDAPAASTSGSAPAASTAGSGEAPATSTAGSAPAASTSGSGEAPATSTAGSAPAASTTGSGEAPAASTTGSAPAASTAGSGEAPAASTSGSAPAASSDQSGWEDPTQ